MKKINFETLDERNDYSLTQFIRRGVDMEFIKKGKNYLIKNSNGRVVSEKEKLELENGELIIKDITSNECQQETTKKIKRNRKRIKEIEKSTTAKVKTKIEPINVDEMVKEIQRVVADDTNKETTESI